MTINFYPDKVKQQELIDSYNNASRLLSKIDNLPELRNYIICTLDLFQKYDNELARVALDALEKLRAVINPNFSCPILKALESPICSSYLLCHLYLKVASDPRYYDLQNHILSEGLELDKMNADALHRECLNLLDFYAETT